MPCCCVSTTPPSHRAACSAGNTPCRLRADGRPHCPPRTVHDGQSEKSRVGDVTDAGRELVILTRHNKPLFVLISYEHYERIRVGADHSRKT
ncbi:type II toxin-antitoxin system Phd/YefM family antitoxin [Rhizobium sp. BT-175]|uniref:type II toxin-antitoxin system Phd/YefM family antitoxin n=1 Tax=Rhizobium sp. BT-175 TaxID=2986929 RepID=UPI0035583C52